MSEIEHRRKDNKTCVCGFTTTDHRGLNSHIGNILRNRKLKHSDKCIDYNDKFWGGQVYNRECICDE